LGNYGKLFPKSWREESYKILLQIYKRVNMTDQQTLQAAINAASNTHTGFHRAIYELRHGSIIEAKQLLAQQIAVLANALILL